MQETYKKTIGNFPHKKYTLRTNIRNDDGNEEDTNLNYLNKMRKKTQTQ